MSSCLCQSVQKKLGSYCHLPRRCLYTLQAQLIMTNGSVQEASSEHEWVLCLDDDVLVHERFLEDLVHDMQQNPAASMATGVVPTYAHSAHCLSQGDVPRLGLAYNKRTVIHLHMKAILLLHRKETSASL